MSQLQILVIGGTQFVGIHIVERALANGHSVTLFNRGKTNTDLFPDAEKLVGDRNDGDLSVLTGRHFDTIIDVSAYFPRAVEDVLEATTSDHYIFVSTVSVYASFEDDGQNEDGLLGATDSFIGTEEITGESYGPLKVLCEERVATHPKHTILRPGLIVGPNDHTDRFTYWAARTARGGNMLCPEPTDRAVQFIDVRDFAAFTLSCAENQTFGIFNVVTPPGHTTMASLLSATSAATGVVPEYVWLKPDQLEEFELAGWRDFPAWIPQDSESAGMVTTDSSRAMRVGLKCRPLEKTVNDTWSWFKNQDRDCKAGLPHDREQEIIDALTT